MTTTLQLQPHPFAHIMDGPYSYVSISFPEDRTAAAEDNKENGRVYTSNNSGGTCDCCHTAITICVAIKGSLGVFHVGSDCARKATQSPKVLDIIKTQLNKRNADKRKQKLQLDMVEADEWIALNQSTLKALPHPKGFDGLTLLDYLFWYRKNSGNAKFIITYKDVRVSIA